MTSLRVVTNLGSNQVPNNFGMELRKLVTSTLKANFENFSLEIVTNARMIQGDSDSPTIFISLKSIGNVPHHDMLFLTSKITKLCEEILKLPKKKIGIEFFNVETNQSTDEGITMEVQPPGSEKMINCSKFLSAIIPLDVPRLEELQEVIRLGLAQNFKDVVVKISKCQDFTKLGFSFKYFGASLKIADVGGVGNLFPVIKKEKFFDIKEICELLDSKHGAAFGVGAGPWTTTDGRSSVGEMVADVNSGRNTVNTKIFKTDDSAKGFQLKTISSSKFNISGNLAITAEPEKQVDVVHLHVKDRTGKLNLIETIRTALSKKYEQRTVSLAGIFVIRKGKVKVHINGDFPKDWNHKDELTLLWLKYFEMNAPLVGCTVMHSYDPGNNLRMEHTHLFSQHGDTGHYHYDTTPEEVEYEGWFAPAEKIFRIDEI